MSNFAKYPFTSTTNSLVAAFGTTTSTTTTTSTMMTTEKPIDATVQLIIQTGASEYRHNVPKGDKSARITRSYLEALRTAFPSDRIIYDAMIKELGGST